MGILDVFRRAKNINPNIFNFVGDKAAPDITGDQFLRAYKGWVYACVSAIAEEVSTIKLVLENKQQDQWITIDDHMILDLLANVNDFDTFSQLIISTESYLQLEGNGFWYLPRGEVTDKPGEIWSLNPVRMTVVKSTETVVDGYIFRNEQGKEIPLTTDEIIHFRRFNPRSRFRGIGTVAAAALAIDVDDFSQQWNKNFYFNSAMPSAVLETKGEITKEQFERLKSEWSKKYTGLNKAHKLAILQGGLTYKPVQMSQKDMDFLEQRKFSRDEILGIFRVPKTILGLTEDVNRASAETSDFVFAKRVIKPRMGFLTDMLNEFLIPMFGLEQNEWRFVFVDPVPDDRDAILKEKEVAFNKWRTINETRETEGRKPIANGDSIYLPINLFPIGDVEDKAVKVIKSKRVTKQERRRFIALVGARREFIHKEIARRTPQYRKIIRNILNDIADRIREAPEERDQVDETRSVKAKVIKGRFSNLMRLVTFTHRGDLEALTDKNVEVLTNVVGESGQVANGVLGVDTPFNTTNPDTLKWINDNALSSAVLINATLKSNVRQIILEGVRGGFSNDEIAGFINDIERDIALTNAKRIARTEIVKAYAQGSIESYRQSGVVIGKEWLTAGDDRVDNDCFSNEADGVIPLNASFSTGEEAPPEHPNCRCVIRPVTSSGLERRAAERIDLTLKAKTKGYKTELDQERTAIQKELRKEGKVMLTDVSKEADAIIAQAIKKGKAERTKLTKQVKKLRDKALELKYGKE